MLSYQDIRRAVGGRFFRVVFVKRSDGTVRSMNARLNVTKHLTGGGAKYSFQDKNLLPVWDAVKRSYRSVPLDAILEFRCGNIILADNGLLGKEMSDEEYKQRKLRDLQSDPDNGPQERPAWR